MICDIVKKISLYFMTVPIVKVEGDADADKR